jgi:CopG family transcriptional regulator/antitoxin EndoAI
MYQKINITLPEQTLHLIEQMTGRKNRSRFIDEALKYYMEQVGKIKLREQLKQGAVKRAERDLKLSQEWNGLEDDAW